MLALALLSAVTAMAPQENQLVLPEQVTFITPAMFESWDPKVDDAVVATFPGTHINPERAKLDPNGTAPQWIVVRHRDGLFGIDPFLPLPDVDNNTMRQLFKPVKYGTTGPSVTLDTDQSLYGWRRTERTEELFAALETARVIWLKKHGYIRSVRTVSGSASAGDAQTQAPEPRLMMPVPADKPRTKPIESVEKSSSKAIVLKGDEPVTISLPDRGISADMKARVEARQSKAADRMASAERKSEESTKP
jgi:hypothetical protein